ncbi:MAG TPA: adenylate/guanylate cyclase domain-containing protein [Kiloniellales bacterium]|nr:adenylate/guanylate cyclase domain-containing protein [Kiloniellales bacterium]
MDQLAPALRAAGDPRRKSLCAWLLGEAREAMDVSEVLDGFGRRLVAAGVPLVRASTHIQALHSERTGTGRVWRPDNGIVEQHYGFDPEEEKAYQVSPIRTVHDSRKPLELWPQRDEINYGVLPDLKAEGVVHYWLVPLFFTDGSVQAASFSTKEKGGFLPEDMALIASLLPLYTQVLELKTVRRELAEVLSIYVGREPGSRILAGQVRRGEVSSLSAAILFADLRGFTKLSNELDNNALVSLLNRYFDCFVPPVAAQGGEVLKFIGDALLAIFPQPEGEAPVAEPRVRALAAAEEGLANLATYNAQERAGLEPLRAGIALHLGRVAYGNVGSVERQDFTVIGRDVNLVSRLASISSRLGSHPLLASQAFVKGLNRPSQALGTFRMKGFREKQPVFALPEPGAALPPAIHASVQAEASQSPAG